MSASFQLVEIPAVGGAGAAGITYIVSHDGRVFFTREYTRHVSLLSRTREPRQAIAWGGILNESGEWVRRSFDFGDAPDLESRDLVVALICTQKQAGASPRPA